MEKNISELSLRESILLYLNNDQDRFSSKDSDIAVLKKIIKGKEKDTLEILEKMERDGEIVIDEQNGTPSSIQFTEKGEKKGEEIWNHIKDEKIRVVDEKDNVTMTLEKASEISMGISTIELIARSNIEKIVDLREEKEIIEKFIGREKNLKFLKEKVDALEENQGGTVLIEGEVGIGKTRLFKKIKQYTIEKNINFLGSRCKQEEFIPISL